MIARMAASSRAPARATSSASVAARDSMGGAWAWRMVALSVGNSTAHGLDAATAKRFPRFAKHHEKTSSPGKADDLKESVAPIGEGVMTHDGIFLKDAWYVAAWDHELIDGRKL